MPAIYKILIVFFGMLVVTRAKVPLGLSLIAAGITLSRWAGTGWQGTWANFLASVWRGEIWLVLGITLLVVEFGRFVTEKENSDEILGVIRRWGGRHGRTWSLMAVPAVVGLIPMPAGALFSAPFVEKSAGDGEWSREWKSAVNYWFRHLWEYWWPLYPGVIVAMSVFGLAHWKFLAAQVPYSVAAILAGYFFLIRRHVERLATPVMEENGGSARRAFFVFLPLMLVLISVVALPPVFDRALIGMPSGNRRMLAMLSGLLLGVGAIVWDEKKLRNQVKVFGTAFKRPSLGILLTVAGVMIFKHMLELSELVKVASEEMQRSEISLMFLVAGLPCLAGLITGLSLGFTGTSLPLVVGLMNAPNSGLSPMSTLVLAYGCGYIGMMLSPVHLCLLVTKDYFASSLFRVYRQIVSCVAVIAAYAVAAHLVFGWLGW